MVFHCTSGNLSWGPLNEPHEYILLPKCVDYKQTIKLKKKRNENSKLKLNTFIKAKRYQIPNTKLNCATIKYLYG